MWLFRKIFGTKNDRELKKLQPLITRINEFETQFQSLTDDQLRAKTVELRERIEAGRKEKGYPELIAKVRELESELRGDEAKTERRNAFDLEQQILNDILPEAFAVVKNACRRLCGQDVIVRGHPLRWEMVPFDVQLIGGMGLHLGKIAEMATGEGKTLVATLPVYLNALTGRGVPLNQVATLEYAFEPGMIWRRDRTPTITVRGNLYGAVQPATVTAQLQPEINKLAASLPLGYHIDVGGSVEESAKGGKSVAAGMPLFLIVVLTVLMIQLHSFSRVAMVVLTAPLGMIGVTA